MDFEVPEPDGPYGLKAWVLEHQAQFPGNEVLAAQLDEWVRGSVQHGHFSRAAFRALTST